MHVYAMKCDTYCAVLRFRQVERVHALSQTLLHEFSAKSKLQIDLSLKHLLRFLMKVTCWSIREFKIQEK